MSDVYEVNWAKVPPLLRPFEAAAIGCEKVNQITREERPEGSEETVDAFGIPFIGFPVQKENAFVPENGGNKPVWIEPIKRK